MTRFQKRPITFVLVFLLLITALYLLTYRGNIGVIDEGAMLAVTSDLVDDHTFTINNLYPDLVPWGMPKSDLSKPIYSNYAPGLSLLAAPWYEVGELVPIHAEKTLNHLPYVPLIPFYFTLLLNTVTTAMTALAILLTARLWGLSWRRGTLLTLLFAVTTLAWPYAKTFYNEPATSMATAWMVYFAVRFHQRTRSGFNGIKDAFNAGLFLGLAILLRTTSVLFIPILLLYMFPRWRGWLAVAPGIIMGIGITLGYNYLRYHNIFTSGYEPGFGRAPWEALLGYLISPSRSFFLFNPVTLLAIPGAFFFLKQRWRDAGLLLGLIAVQVGIYSVWWAWDGGQALGPRFLVPVIPLAILLLVPLLERRRWRVLLITLASLGLLIQIFCNLANVNDVFYEVINQQQFSLFDLNWRLAASIPANLWRAYSLHGIDSLLLRYLPPHEPLAKALIFVGLTFLVIGAIFWWIRSKNSPDQRNLVVNSQEIT